MGTSIKPLMKANQAADDSEGGDHSRRPPQSDRVPSPRLILSHRALSLGGYDGLHQREERGADERGGVHTEKDFTEAFATVDYRV